MDSTFTVSFPGLGIHDIVINRVAFTLFGIDVYWYGLLIEAAVVIGLFLAYRAAPKYHVRSETVLDTMIAIVPLMIIGARLYYVFLSWDEFRDDPIKILNIRTGGLAFYGGVIGGAVGMLIISRLRRVSLTRMMDLMVVYVPLGQAMGRWGNFFNQEAFGTNTTLPWGMISDGTAEYLRQTGTGDPSLPVHPTFFYEFAANMVIFAILLIVRKRSKRPFITTATYLLSYGLVRFFVEQLRTDSLFIGDTGIRASVVLSGVLFLGALIAIILIKLRPVSYYEQKAAIAETLAAAASESSETASEDSDMPGEAGGDSAETDKTADGPAIPDETADKPAMPDETEDKPAMPDETEDKPAMPDERAEDSAKNDKAGDDSVVR